MRIIAADIYDENLHRCKPPIILRLCTDEGLYGLGVTLNEDYVGRVPHIRLEP